MRRQHGWKIEDDERGANRQSQSLAALALVLALVVASLMLVGLLRVKGAVEDCLLAGRTNCASSQGAAER